jgi:hypothetical protein
MGYQYALHQHKKKLLQEKSELRRSHETNNTSSRLHWEECGMPESSEERHRDPKHNKRRTEWPRKEGRTKNLNSSFLTVDEDGNIMQDTPEPALVAAQAYLLTMQPENEDPRESMHQAAIKILVFIRDKLKQKSLEKEATRHEQKGK